MEDQREETALCSCPPALDDLALIAAVDGEADEVTLDHLRNCPHCTERANDFDELQRLLRQRLFRILCPSGEELAAYQQGWLEMQRREQIRDHVRDCPFCSGELRLLVDAGQAAQAPQPPSPLGGLRRIIAVALAPLRTPLAPAYGGLRAGGFSGQHAYRAENLELTLDIQRGSSRPGRLALVGMLLNEEGLAGGMSRATASLLSEDLVVSSAPLDDLGSFVLEDLAPGNYSLSLRLPDLEVVVEALSL
jgi:hypothetical protein